MHVVVLVEELHVARVLDIAGGLERLDLAQRVLVHRGLEHVPGVRVVRGDVGHHVGDREPLERVRMREGILDREDPAPGLPVQHEAVPLKAEGLPNLFDFVDEAVELPQ